MSKREDSSSNLNDLDDVEYMFNQLFEDILIKKQNLFLLKTSSISLKMHKEVGMMGTVEEIRFLESELKKVSEFLTNEQQIVVVPDRLTRESLWEDEFAQLSFDEALWKLGDLHNRRPDDYIKLIGFKIDYSGKDFDSKSKIYDKFVTSVAEKNLHPHIYDYLLERIAELRKESNSSRSHTGIRSVPFHETGKSEKKAKLTNKTKKITGFEWLKEDSDRDGSLRDKRLKHLHHSLQKYGFIDQIGFNIFKGHFSGITNIKLINWTTYQMQLIYLLNKLKPYMSPVVYKKNPSPTIISQHFYFDGNPVKTSTLSVMMSNMDIYSNKIIEAKIDLIIKGIDNI